MPDASPPAASRVGDGPYSISIFAARIKSPQRLISPSSSAPCSAGVLAASRMPSAPSLSCTAGVSTASRTAALSAAITASGVPAGAASAFHEATW